ncbi:hypothetical protein M426DRAFT_324475 [Hypoxylon sp. CI-4A]|nr:hypothetical protein M426DRAFT_324475 [Hypoxylon sp. CI-4A]
MMPSILSLPVELISYVINDLDVQDLSAFSRSCRAIHNITTPFLYRLVKDEVSIMCWAADEGRKGTIEHLLAAGANPNAAFVQSCTRPAVLRIIKTCEPFMSNPNPNPNPNPDSGSSSISSFRFDMSGAGNSLVSDQGNNISEPSNSFISGPSSNLIPDSSSNIMSESSNSFISEPSDSEASDNSFLSDGMDLDPGSFFPFLFPDDEDDEDMDDDDDDDELYYTQRDTRGFGFEDSGDLASKYYWTPLHIAARWGHNEIVDLLLKHGADIHALSRGFCECGLPKEEPRYYLTNSTTPLWYPLHSAICNGNESTARLLLQRGASINVSPRWLGSDVRQVTALHTACYSNMVSIARFLTDEGHQPNADVEDHNGSTPMTYAYSNGSWASIDFLMEAGASINATLGVFPLLKHACSEGRFAEALRFIELGADIAACFDSCDDTEPIIHYCCMPNHPPESWLYSREQGQDHFRPEVIRALIKAGADLEIKDIHGMTPLLKASFFGIPSAAEALLLEGANIRARDDLGNTALMKACSPLGIPPKGATPKTVVVLLRYVTPDAADTFDALSKICGSTARNKDKVDVVRLLLRHGGVDALGFGGSNVLLLKGLASGNFELCDTLLESGLKQPTPQEIQILIHKALAMDRPDALEYISKLRHGSEAVISPRLLFEAIKEDTPNCVEYLIKEGVPIDYESDDGENCLIEACRSGETTIARLLLEKGADPNGTMGGSFPLTHPVLVEHAAMIELLLDYGASMHRHPHGTKIDGRNFGALDLAIFCGLEVSVETMVDHEEYYKSTEEERISHLQTACCAEGRVFADGNILDTLLATCDVDLDTVFRSGPGGNTTPLHICMALGNEMGVNCLVGAGANIHKYLEPAEPPRSLLVPNPFERTTPLEWAIDNSPIEILGELLSDPLECRLWDLDDPEIPLPRYLRAASRRHKPEVMQLLLDAGLDPDTCDESGNPFLAIFCDTIDHIWPFEDPNWPASKIAERSAMCVVILLEQGVDPLQKDAGGVPAIEHVRRIMNYSGTSEFHQEVAKAWNEKLELDETTVRQKRH